MVTRWILIACTVSLVLIFTLLIYCIRAKNNIHNSKDEPDGMIHGKGFLNESEEKSDALKPVNKSVISQGKNSTVWHGFFNGKAVALKYFSRNEESLWQNECSIYSKCTPGHENILTFIAASDPRDNLNQIWLATSFYDQGSLQDFLTAHTLTWDKLLTMAKCITAGLSFLHSERQPDGKPKAAIAHQDLKSKNILVGNDGTCVLADFGLSMDLSQGYLSQVHKNGQVSRGFCQYAFGGRSGEKKSRYCELCQFPDPPQVMVTLSASTFCSYVCQSYLAYPLSLNEFEHAPTYRFSTTLL